MNPMRILWLFCFAVLLPGFGAIGSATAAEAKAGPPPAPVVVADAVRRELAPFTWYAGAVISKNDARMAAEVAGRLVWVADVGTHVGAGEIVARLDDALLKRQVAEQEAAVASHTARLKFLNKDVTRLSRLAKQNNAAQSQLDQAIADRGVSRADLAAAKARVEYTREQLSRTEMRAPFDGVVAERFKQAGEWSDSGKEVVRLVDPGTLEIQTRVPVGTLAQVTLGSELQTRGNKREDIAKVQSIVPVGDDRSRLYELRLAPAAGDWSAGQTVRVAIPTAAAREVIAIPRDALVLRRDGIRVFRVKEDNTAEVVIVSTGVASGELIEVQGGIRAGDRVVVRGGERLRPGQPVAVRPDGTQP
ncbi:MAG: efflux RND transporter periplasmic adaptor subunit [Pseudomonadota bacterium]|nr:MAG: efflux RND transporter periplasmic adaptor subunit [Pseudomonadota bacterium]